VTEKHLCRLFTKTLGHAPLKTFTLLKLQGARQLLTRTNLSVTEIAERCGFNSPFYFSRCFSKTFGVPPSALRTTPEQELPALPDHPLPPDLIPRTYW
jgi:transcriptional regulator GlxA family with amidase domain